MESSKLKVLYIDPTQGTGGATSSLLALIKSLDEGTIKAFLLRHMAGTLDDAFLHNGVKILPQKLKLTKAVMFDPHLGIESKYQFINKIIKCIGLIIKQLNLLFAIVLDYSSILYAIKKYHINIVHFNSYRQIYLPLAFFCKVLRCVVIFHVRYQTTPPPSIYHWFTRFSSFFFVSRFVRDGYLWTGIKTKFNTVVYNGRFPEQFACVLSNERKKKFMQDLSIPSQNKIVINISTLTRGKGQDTFIKAAALVCQQRDDVTFLIVGDNVPYEDDIKSELVDLISELHLEGRVLLLGQRTDIPELLAISDISVVATELEEALCGVNIETMASKTPLIATDIGSVREVVIPEKTGVLVPPGDHRSMAEAIMRLLNNEEEASEFAENGYRRFMKVFNAKQNTARMIDYYQELYSGPQKWDNMVK